MQFKQNGLYNQYASLNLTRLSAMRRAETPQPVRRSHSPSIQTQTDSPKSPPKPILKKSVSTQSPKTVKIVEPEEEVVEEPPKPESPKAPSPVKTEPPPKPIPAEKPKPVRATVVPKKGEKGLQKKWTSEQRRQQYLNKLSRKSLKRAEAEVNEVQKVLHEADYNEEKINETEKALKTKLKLVNCAKLFLLETEPEEEDSKLDND